VSVVDVNTAGAADRLRPPDLTSRKPGEIFHGWTYTLTTRSPRSLRCTARLWRTTTATWTPQYRRYARCGRPYILTFRSFLVMYSVVTSEQWFGASPNSVRTGLDHLRLSHFRRTLSSSWIRLVIRSASDVTRGTTNGSKEWEWSASPSRRGLCSVTFHRWPLISPSCGSLTFARECFVRRSWRPYTGLIQVTLQFTLERRCQGRSTALMSMEVSVAAILLTTTLGPAKMPETNPLRRDYSGSVRIIRWRAR
jgi:hypothetical protein